MSIIKPITFKNFNTNDSTNNASQDLSVLSDLVFDIDFSLGKTKKNLKEVNYFTKGTLIETDIDINNKVNIIANGKKVGVGEILVSNDGKLFVKII